MKIRFDKNNINDVFYPLLTNKNRYLILYGGAGSGKSHFACQDILLRTVGEKGHRFLVIRKVAKTLRRSAFQLFIDYIGKWGWYKLFKINRSEMTITCSNGNEILFAGIDDPEKLKSIEGVTGIWIEEATELALKDFQEIDRRLRGKTANHKQIVMTYNPILDTNWTNKEFFINKKPDCKVLKTTYKDNKFIDKKYEEILEGYTGNARRVYALGEYGKLEHSVFHNWDIVDEFPDTDKEVYGLDWGYEHPLAFIKVYVKEWDMWLDEIVYERHLTNPDFIKKTLDYKDKQIIADSEAPGSIREVADAGFYIIPVVKFKNSRTESIKFMQKYNIHITSHSTNLINEFTLAQRKVDKDGNVFEEMIKQNDDGIDAIRYAIMMTYMQGECGLAFG